jgi:hypothetical protein
MATRLKFVVSAVLLGLAAIASAADRKPPASLADKLQQYYRPVRREAGVEIVRRRPLFLQTSGLLAVAPEDAAYLDVCPTIFRAGELHPTPGFFCAELARKQRTLKVSERVYIASLHVNSTARRVEIHLTTCEPCETTPGPLNLRSLLIFEFPKDFLTTASSDEVIRAIDSFLTAEPIAIATPPHTPDSPEYGRTSSVSPTPDPNVDLPAPSTKSPRKSGPNSAADPARVKKGQTPEEVQKAMGKPRSIVDLGEKLIYVYPNLSLVFLNGKLTDVQ